MYSLEELVPELISTGATLPLLDGIGVVYGSLVDVPGVACQGIGTGSICKLLEDTGEVGELEDDSVPIRPAILEAEYTEYV